MKKYPLVSIVIPTHNRKKKLVRLIRSVLNSNYPRKKLEIIVVDDASRDGTYEEIKKKFPHIKVIRNKKEMLVSKSRNVGIKNSKGKYIFLIDDDNVVDKNCILELVKVMETRTNSQIGIAGPITYYLKQPKRIWCAGVRRNMITSLTFKIGADKINKGQFNKLIYSDDFPNAFIIRKELIEKVGLFDEKNFPFHYEEADFGERVRKAGYRIVCNPKAKIWHDIPLPEEVEDKTRLFHVNTERRAYYAGRNRIIFHKKYSKWWQFLLFILIFNWIVTIYYLKVIIFSHRSCKDKLRLFFNYLIGICEGLK